MARPTVPLVLAGLVLSLSTAPASAQDFSDVVIRTVPVADGVYMLTGSGGNIGLSVGEDGVFVIDDQYAPLTERILAAIGEITDEPVRFVLNTHWHGDHVGGNENMGRAGALLVAHDNVRERMSVEQVLERFGSPDRTVQASPEGALPVVTFDSEASFHLNGDELRAIHVPRAHTDGDAILHFTGTNVVHMGDTYFESGYPYIDIGSGGSIDGLLAALGRGLALMDPDTRVIPGHGELSDREGVRAYRDMLKAIRDAVAEQKRAGRSLDEVRGMRITAEWDPEWGQGFITPEGIVVAVYQSLPARP